MKYPLSLAALLGVMHALVDASTVTVAFGTLGVHGVTPEFGVALIVSYDLIAFAGQPFLGILADRIGNMRAVVIAGIVLTGASFGAMLLSPLVACVLAGVGNALFHLGAGAVCIKVKEGRAAPTGVFVGPGALGLAFGIYYGKSHAILLWPFALALATALAVSTFLKLPKTHRLPGALPGILSPKFSRPWLGLTLLLSSIFLRSLVGHAGSYGCPKLTWVLFGLGGAACMGKALGGILSDRFGWMRTSVLTLLVSLPLIAFGGENPIMVGVGFLSFQMTMAVTLVAIAMLFPKYPAFAFGLNCLAFILGALPTFYPPIQVFYSPASFSLVIALSIVTVYLGLWTLRDGLTMRFVPVGLEEKK
jgi:FSR family fosmidomycin resistance protein-like MFS transporter